MEPISAIAALATSIVSRIWPDRSQADQQKFTLEMTRELQASSILQKYLDADIEQTKVNLEQAKSSNLFVSGPRPYIMWGLGTILILFFAAQFVISILVAFKYDVIVMPPIDPVMCSIIMGLLGLGYITRSYDKKNEK